MTDLSAPPSEKPAHYRLSTATWALILKEYCEGATAPFLARKWRVSEHAIRKRATQHGATKRDWGDAQAIGQALAREAELEEARRNSPEAVAARLFDGVAAPVGDDGGDAAALMRTAILASGRAMRGRLWTEAKALAGLAESYARLGERTAGVGVTMETMDLKLLYEVLTNDGSLASRRLGLWNDGKDDPERPLKEAYWHWYGKRHTEANDRSMEILNRLYDAEHRLGELGEYPPPPRRDYWCEPVRNAGKGQKDEGGGDEEGGGGENG